MSTCCPFSKMKISSRSRTRAKSAAATHTPPRRVRFTPLWPGAAPDGWLWATTPDPVSSPWLGAVMKDHILPLPVRPHVDRSRAGPAESFAVLTCTLPPACDDPVDLVPHG